MAAILRVLIFACVLITSAQAQPFTFYKTKQYAWYPPGPQGAASGNHCWGYVSPSGREYAIIGYDNKTGFVEITDPTNSTWVGSIPHNSSLWADIKVYQGYCYVVTEGTSPQNNLQVISLLNIDNTTNRVSFVRAVTAAPSSHTVGLDPVSGFLYTHGSNGGTGTTMCFSLADPSNPVQVGENSITDNYMHDAQEVTYTSGPYAGKQILFGCSEGRGLDIYDVTNKNNTTLIKRVVYPNVGYCHQGWLDPERKYFFIDDEFDENNLGIPTRTIVIDVETLATAFYAGTFSTGLASIDHNQYMDGRYLFQANYRTGLRIWDTHSGNFEPTPPTQVGWYDSYPENDLRGYNGAWSVYPFFPSRTVLISDIERGLFIIDASEALSKSAAIDSYTMRSGSVLTGGVPELVNSDNTWLSMRPGAVLTSAQSPLSVEVQGTAITNDVLRVVLGVESSANIGNAVQKIEMYNYNTSTWEVMDSQTAATTDTLVTVTVTSSSGRFINDADNQVKARISWKPSGAVLTYPWNVKLDQVYWAVLPSSPMI